MAAKGFDLQSSCEDCHSSTSNLSYRVSVSQTLCDDCAEKKKDRIQEIEEPVTRPCKHHGTVQASVFCRSHDAWFCGDCAFAKHRSCEAIGIVDAISKRKEELSELITRARAKENELKVLGETTDREIHLAQENLASLHRQISTAREEELKKVDDERTKIAAEIIREADERIRTIMEERDKELQLVDDKASRHREFIEEGKGRLQMHINRVDQAVQSKGSEMKSFRLRATTALAHSIAAAESLANHERYQADDFSPVASSLADNTKVEVDIRSVEQITSIASDMSFCRRDGAALGRIYASKEKWEMADEFYPFIGHTFKLKGTVSQDEVLLQDISSGKVNVTSLESRCIQNIETKNIERTFSCTFFHGEWIVCGTKDGTVVIYNTKSWKAVRTISVTRHHQADILVSVTLNGLILAAVKSESRIHFYNPEDGKLVGSIDVNVRHIQEMHALSSGYIAVLTQCPEGPDVCVLQISGAVQSTYHFHGKKVHSIAVDHASDAVYVMSSVRGHLVVHVVRTLDASVTELTEMRLELRPAWYYQTCVMPKAGTFVISHYGKLLVYKRVSKNQLLEEVLSRDQPFLSAVAQYSYV